MPWVAFNMRWTVDNFKLHQEYKLIAVRKGVRSEEDSRQLCTWKGYFISPVIIWYHRSTAIERTDWKTPKTQRTALWLRSDSVIKLRRYRWYFGNRNANNLRELRKMLFDQFPWRNRGRRCRRWNVSASHISRPVRSVTAITFELEILTHWVLYSTYGCWQTKCMMREDRFHLSASNRRQIYNVLATLMYSILC